MVLSAPEKKSPVSPAAPVCVRKPWPVRLAPYLVWQVIAVLFVELVLFSAGLGEEEIFKLDPELGSKHMTNKRITWRSEGYAQSYLDADGMREPGLTVAKPANTYRVALLGDSMVEGLQVPIEDTFGQILSRQLSQPGGRQVQVLNFGMSGYSTAQEYLQLKKAVLKYQPDLVLLCYNSRDIFENWSPADQVITNVRPYALHLPGGRLVVGNDTVLAWLKSPRARLLRQVDWLRQNSRIWGIISGLELEMSFRNPVYRAVIGFLTRPKKAIRELFAALKPGDASKPAFQIRTFESTASPPAAGSGAQTSGNARTGAPVVSDKVLSGAVAVKPENGRPAVRPQLISAAPNAVLERSPIAQSAAGQPDGRKTYIELITRTLSSLIDEMRRESRQAGCSFAIATLPVRAALCPAPGMDTAFFNIDYPQEIEMLSQICRDRHIPLIDCQKVAERLSPRKRKALFYTMHLTRAGHQFLADCLCGYLQRQIGQPAQ